ncbi:MAG: Rieske 2Fe-2S domain-containing protein [Planctomycetota bacterium]
MSGAWREHWFPLAFMRDLEPGRIDRIGLHERHIALFLDAAGQPAALLDRCPHRTARLSDGRVREGTLECLYHGWRFDRSGACVEAPQQPADTPMPPRSCATALPVRVEQGVVWAWGGRGAASADAPPAAGPATVAGLDRAGVHSVDFVMDLPYGQDAFIENVLDVAHIHVAHAGTRGGGDRRLAGPLDVELEHEGPEGFAATFRTRGLAGAQRTAGLRRAWVEFRAPNLVHYVSDFEDPSLVSGLALYSLPTGPDSARMLYRAYGNLWTEADRKRPRWVEHLGQCHLLEEDMAVVRGQVEAIDRSDETLAELWQPLRTSDRLVVRYREWIDRHALDRPGAVGLRSVGARRIHEPRVALDRWTLHSRHCADCRAAHARLTRRRVGWSRGALVALAVAAASPVAWAWLPALGALAATGFAHRDGAQAEALVKERDLRRSRPPQVTTFS